VVLKFEQDWYTTKDVARIIKKSAVSVVKMFKDRPGVWDAATEHKVGTHNRMHLRIPAYTLEQFLRERMLNN